MEARLSDLTLIYTEMQLSTKQCWHCCGGRDDGAIRGCQVKRLKEDNGQLDLELQQAKRERLQTRVGSQLSTAEVEMAAREQVPRNCFAGQRHCAWHLRRVTAQQKVIAKT